MSEPVAWVFELARARHAETGEYGLWGPPQLSFTEPSVPEGSIRNLRPLYAAGSTPDAWLRVSPDGERKVATTRPGLDPWQKYDGWKVVPLIVAE